MTRTPASLLQCLAKAPAEAHWQRFISLFTPLMVRWASRMGVRSTDVEDLLQDVFVIVVRRLPELEYDPQRSFRGWLWTVMHHEVLARRGRFPGQVALSEAQLQAISVPDSVAEATEAEYRKHLFARALRIIKADVPERTWQIFWETAVNGRPGNEVARQFQVSANAVYLLRARILARLREELADCLS